MASVPFDILATLRKQQKNRYEIPADPEARRHLLENLPQPQNFDELLAQTPPPLEDPGTIRGETNEDIDREISHAVIDPTVELAGKLGSAPYEMVNAANQAFVEAGTGRPPDYPDIAKHVGENLVRDIRINEQESPRIAGVVKGLPRIALDPLNTFGLGVLGSTGEKIAGGLMGMGAVKSFGEVNKLEETDPAAAKEAFWETMTGLGVPAIVHGGFGVFKHGEPNLSEVPSLPENFDQIPIEGYTMNPYKLGSPESKTWLERWRAGDLTKVQDRDFISPEDANLSPVAKKFNALSPEMQKQAVDLFKPDEVKPEYSALEDFGHAQKEEIPTETVHENELQPLEQSKAEEPISINKDELQSTDYDIEHAKSVLDQLEAIEKGEDFSKSTMRAFRGSTTPELAEAHQAILHDANMNPAMLKASQNIKRFLPFLKQKALEGKIPQERVDQISMDLGVATPAEKGAKVLGITESWRGPEGKKVGVRTTQNPAAAAAYVLDHWDPDSGISLPEAFLDRQLDNILHESAPHAGEELPHGKPGSPEQLAFEKSMEEARGKTAELRQTLKSLISGTEHDYTQQDVIDLATQFKKKVPITTPEGKVLGEMSMEEMLENDRLRNEKGQGQKEEVGNEENLPVFRVGEKSNVLREDVQKIAERAGLGRAEMQRYPIRRIPESEYAKADANPHYTPREETVAYIEAPSERHVERELNKRIKSGELQKGDSIAEPSSQPFIDTKFSDKDYELAQKVLTNPEEIGALGHVPSPEEAARIIAAFEKTKRLSDMPSEDIPILKDLATNAEVTDPTALADIASQLSPMGRRFAHHLLTGKSMTPEEIIADTAKFNAKKVPLGKQVRSAVSGTASTMRAMMASYDLSAPLRQGYILSASHPMIAAKAFAKQFEYFKSKEAFEALEDSIQTSPNYDLYKESGLQFSSPVTHKTGALAAEEPFQSQFAEKYIPGIRQSEQAYTGFLNFQRKEVFDLEAKTFEDLMKDPGQDLQEFRNQNAETYRNLAAFINNATGRGSLGGLEKHAQLLTDVFFSPRLIASRLRLMNPVEYIKMDSYSRKVALKSMAKAATATMMIAGMAKMAGADVEMDPRSTDFMKIKIGNTRYDLTAGFQPYVRLFAQLASGQEKVGGKVRDLKPGSFSSNSRLQKVARFGEGKLSPMAGLVVDALRGTDFKGEKFGVSDVGQRFVPMVAQDFADIWKQEGAKAFPMIVPGIFGAGVQTYKPRTKKARKSTGVLQAF